jgi:cytochrome c-type biogenesis protein CcmF
MFGQYIIHFLFVSSLLSTIAYFLAYRGSESYKIAARSLFYATAGSLVVSFFMVFYNILQHDFSFSYVWSYSSRELSTPFLFAATYSGQEGSFLLWTLWVSIIGVTLIPWLKKHKYEAEVMSFLALIISFLGLMLIVKNPFSYVWESFAKDGIQQGFIPQNGRGLNPLLHNIWITIHPPILFIGFASMSIPFVFAMAGLVKKEYQEWISVALPWTLFGTAVLGFGIMLGGFWAYETLGWGGFWGWDPVENSSLLPWLASVALVHTMIVQRKTKGLVKTNFVLSTLTFVLVLYSTFLTRSGVLGDTSVHSFVDPGFFAYVLLLVFMGVFIVLGFGLVFSRLKDISSKQEKLAIQSKEFMLSIGSSLIVASTIIVFIGTSWPIFMEVFGRPKVAVEIGFYNKMHVPIVIAMMFINAISMMVAWRSSSWNILKSKIIVPLAISLALTIGSFFLGIQDIGMILIVFASLLSLVINIQIGFAIARKSIGNIGAYISHTGIALLMIGIVTTSSYSIIDKSVRLVQNVPTNILGYTVTFKGKEQIEKQYKDREKYRYILSVEKDGKTTIITPILYWSDFNKRQSAFLEPGISWSLQHDFYVAPKALETEGQLPEVTIGKFEPAPFPLDTTATITLEGFLMTPNENGSVKMGANLVYATADSVKKTFTAFSNRSTSGTVSSEPILIPGTTYQVSFDNLIANKAELSKSKAKLLVADTKKPETFPKEVFVVEASIKPLINLVWFGVIAMVAGFFVSIYRYTKTQNKVSEEKEITT